EFFQTRVGHIPLKQIPAGTFWMGSPSKDKTVPDGEKPQHEVRISRPFYLGVYEVTQAQYREVMNENPSYFSGAGEGKAEVEGQSTAAQRGENVSGFDPVRFCNELTRKEDQLSKDEGHKPYYEIAGDKVRVPDWKGTGYRLPTEAEWEYACRAGS